MTDPSTIGRASKDTYLQWRERLAEKHAARREPAEASPAAPSNPWDPGLLFVSAATSDLDAPEADVIAGFVDTHEAEDDHAGVGDASERTIDLRLVGSAPEHPIQLPDRAPAGSGDVRGARIVDLTPPSPGLATDAPPLRHDARKDRYDSVMARLEHTPSSVRPLFNDTSLAAALRDLNERRLEGKISDEQFRAQKAALFVRSSRV